MVRKLRGEEEWVRQCIEAATPGSAVRQHDDGSEPGMHDLEVFVADNRVGAVEVSAAVDSAALQLWSLITKPGGWTDDRLTGGWIVNVSRTARYRGLKESLPGLLQRLESQGRHELDQDWFGLPDEEQQAAARLGIESATQGGTDRPGSIYVLVGSPPEQRGGVAPDNADCVARWLEEWLRRDDQLDNLGKLVRSGAAERHMVVLVTGVSPAPFEVEYALMSDDITLPLAAPELPDAITHCWVMSSWSAGRGLMWRPGGWSWFDKLQSR